MATIDTPAPNATGAQENRGTLEQLTDLIEEINELPWATMIVFLFAIVGAVGTFADAMTFQQYLERVLAAAAVLGVGRGVAASGSGSAEKKKQRRIRKAAAKR